MTGPKGELEVPIGRGVEVKQEDGKPRPGASLGVAGAQVHARAHAVTGAERCYRRYGRLHPKTLQIAGVGYRAALQGQNINLQVGYSHPVSVSPREGIEFEVPAPTTIIVRGIDKQRVGQTAAEIRKVRPPEPYKGKGIRYEDEQIRRKVGKAG